MVLGARERVSDFLEIIQVMDVVNRLVGLAIDDSGMQRKLMYRLLNTAVGISDDRVYVQGATDDEIRSFDTFVMETMEAYDDAYKMILLLDENIDGRHFEGRKGTEIANTLVNRMTSDQRARMIIVIRSANDSSADIQRYLHAADAFLPKTTLDRQRVHAVIAPFLM